jgi:hypothetical protein
LCGHCQTCSAPDAVCPAPFSPPPPPPPPPPTPTTHHHHHHRAALESYTFNVTVPGCENGCPNQPVHPVTAHLRWDIQQLQQSVFLYANVTPVECAAGNGHVQAVKELLLVRCVLVFVGSSPAPTSLRHLVVGYHRASWLNLGMLPHTHTHTHMHSWLTWLCPALRCAASRAPSRPRLCRSPYSAASRRVVCCCLRSTCAASTSSTTPSTSPRQR